MHGVDAQTARGASRRAPAAGQGGCNLRPAVTPAAAETCYAPAIVQASTQTDSTGPVPEDPKQFAAEIADHIARNQGTEIAILDVSAHLVIADCFVIATCRNTRHAQGLGRQVDAWLKHRGRLRRNLSGLENESPWVLLDFDDVVVHLFESEARGFYGLESLWADVPQVDYAPPADVPVTPPVGAFEGDPDLHMPRPAPTANLEPSAPPEGDAPADPTNDETPED